MSLEFFLPQEPRSGASGTFDVVIVGAGPAGLTAGIYTARGRLSTVILERNTAGGQMALTERIENYPGFPEGIAGFDLTEKMKKQATQFGADLREITTVAAMEPAEGGRWTIITDQETITGKVIILAPGVVPKTVGVPGEAEFLGRGVSYCATCDGALYRDKQVVVVGGGDSAVEEGLFLTKFASAVRVIHRRDELRANKLSQERAFANPRMEFIWDSVPRVIRGETKVEGVEIQNVKTKALSLVPADGVFIYVGQIPNTTFLQNIVELDEWGYIKTDELMRTAQPGVFACGDAKVGPIKQIAWAVGEGALAGIQAEKYLDTLACVETTGASPEVCEAGLAGAGGDETAAGAGDGTGKTGDGDGTGKTGDGAGTSGVQVVEGAASAAGEPAASGEKNPA
ncbi:MAG TPA: thioredoxin-disulfide reductase [Thermoleophilia bacterium]|nr:thioredoxin-disulfide reductase [Thermoleophilia bacterium]